MEILIITPYLPYPLDSGGAQAQFHHIDSLRSKFKFSIAFPIKKESEGVLNALKEKWTNVNFYPFFIDETREKQGNLYYNILQKIQRSSNRKIRRYENQHPLNDDLIRVNSCLKDSVNSTSAIPDGFSDFILDIIKKEAFNLIEVEFFEFLPLIYLLKRNTQSKCLFVHHELRYIRNKREISLFKEKTGQDEFEYSISKSQEINALGEYDYIITLTDTDRLLLNSELLEKKVFTSPAVIKIKKADEKDQKFEKRNQLIFLGSSSHFPNYDAIDWYANDILPIIQSKGENIPLQITGHWKKQQKKWYEQKASSIKFLGFVEDLQSVLTKSIMIVPIRIGSGMRMKLIDAALSKTPFITTSIGVEGLDFVNEEDCLIADTPVEFAQQCIRLIKDEKLQEKLANHAYKKLTETYNPAQLIEVRASVYNQINQEQ